MKLIKLKKEIITLVVVLIIIVIANLVIRGYNNIKVDKKISKQIEEVVYKESIKEQVNVSSLNMSNRSCLNGKERINDYNGQIIATVIDNYIEARPQSGIEKANLVIEAPVEAKITRWLAFFDLSTVENIEKIGPIRSARPYFLDWLRPYDSMFMHVGGSPEALEKIKDYGLNDLNQFFNSQYYWRSKNRYAPHNVYTSTDLIEEAVENKGFVKNNQYNCFAFSNNFENTEKKPIITNIKIDNYWSDYTVNWQYDNEDNYYIRYNDSSITKTETGSRILAKNVIIILTDIEIVDDYGRRKIKTIGNGDAFIFNNGIQIKGTWEKESPKKRMIFKDNNENEIIFSPGLIWIHVIENKENIILDIKE